MAFLAGLSASAQVLETNSMASLNDTITGGYIFNFADLTPTSDSASINCISGLLNLQGATGATGEIVKVDGNADTDRAYELTLKQNRANPYLKFNTGNCANMNENPLDLSDDMSTAKLRLRVKADRDFGKLQLHPVGIKSDGVNLQPIFYEWYKESSNFTWMEPIPLLANEWKVIELDLNDFSEKDSTFAMSGDDLIGLRISHSWWNATAGTSEYPDVVLTFDWISFGTSVEVLATQDLFVTGLNVYPNPATDQLNVVFDATSISTVQLSDLTGKIVDIQTAKVGANKINFDVATVNAGVYFVNIKNAAGNTAQKVIIK